MLTPDFRLYIITYSVPTSQHTPSSSIKKTQSVKAVRDIIAVYCEKHKKRRVPERKSRRYIVYIYPRALKVHICLNFTL